MKYLPIVFLALLALTGCRSAGSQYQTNSPPGSYETYVPPAGYENSGPPVSYDGGVSKGASSGSCPSCR